MFRVAIITRYLGHEIAFLFFEAAATPGVPQDVARHEAVPGVGTATCSDRSDQGIGRVIPDLAAPLGRGQNT